MALQAGQGTIILFIVGEGIIVTFIVFRDNKTTGQGTLVCLFIYCFVTRTIYIYCFAKRLSLYYLLLLLVYNYLLWWCSSLQYIACETLFLQYFCLELGRPTIVLKKYGFLGSHQKSRNWKISYPRLPPVIMSALWIFVLIRPLSYKSQSTIAFNM